MKFKPIPALREQDIGRFNKKIEVVDECWLWRAASDADGYGIFWLPEGNFKAHRIAYYIAHQIDPSEHTVYNTCKTLKCVRPSHLLLTIEGEHPLRRNEIGDDIEAEVMKLLGQIKQSAIAARLKISKTTVSRIKLKRYATN
jgi:hypothetical protein